MQKERPIDINDTNLANYGSKEHKDARKNAAKSEAEYRGAGEKVGLEIWRVENRRTENDTPDFGVKRWPRNQYGSFYSGDSYIVLNTYKVKDEKTKKEKLCYDAHFWLGKESSQDEIGVAAYKTVELDDLLDDAAIQHREVQGHESALFLSYFPKGLVIMKGGIDSGFRHVEPDKYVPRLFEVRRGGDKAVRTAEVELNIKSLSQDDCFVLDAGTKIYSFIGSESDAFEKSKVASLASSIAAGREGKSKVVPVDDQFWKLLGAKGPGDIPKNRAGARPADPTSKPMDANSCVLYRLSDASGQMSFKKEREGKLDHTMLDSNDVFIIDSHVVLFIWIGKGANEKERSQAFKYATQYLREHNLPTTTPITRVVEGQVHFALGELLGGSTEGQAGKTTYGIPPKKSGGICAVM